MNRPRHIPGWGYAFFACLALGIPATGDDTLRVRVDSEIQPGINRTIRRFDSCILDLGTVPEDVEITGLTSDPYLRKMLFPFKGEEIQIQVVQNAHANGRPLAFVPKQPFVIDTNESLHKSLANMVTVHGYYALFKLDKAQSGTDQITQQMNSWFFSIRVTVAREWLGAGHYYLVPIEKLAILERVLAGSTAPWDFRPPPRPEMSSSPATLLKPTPGIVRTGQGTYYSFRENGTIVIYTRRGEVVTIGPSRSPDEPSYASHLSILRRQNIRLTFEEEKLFQEDPVATIERGIAENRNLIAAHQRNDSALIGRSGIYWHGLADVRRDFTQATERKDRQSALENALYKAAEADELLPPLLRWQTADAGPLFRAPRDQQARYVGRVVRPFLYLRLHEGSAASLNPVQLLAENDLDDPSQRSVAHLQVLHAYLGALALEAEAFDLVAGGHLAYTYDVETGKLIKIQLESNGLVSLARPGAMRALTEEEVAILKEHISLRLPGQPRHGITLDFKTRMGIVQ